MNVISHDQEPVISKIPSWTYQLADFPDNEWELYSRELNKFWIAYSKKHVPEKAQFFFVAIENDEHKFKIFCPTLYNALVEKDYLKHVIGIAFLVVPPTQKTAIHTDSGDQSTALNIPVMNCEKSYTVWYRTKDKLDDGHELSYVKSDSLLSKDSFDEYLRYDSDYFDFNSSEEIDRVECNRPLWVNYKIPHRPEVEHNNLRILASIRFDSEFLIDFNK